MEASGGEGLRGQPSCDVEEEQGSATVWLRWLGAGESSATGVFSGNLAETSAQTRKTSSASRTTIIAVRVHDLVSLIDDSGTLLIHNPFDMNTNRGGRC